MNARWTLCVGLVGLLLGGCACKGYRVALLPSEDMNARKGAVRVDLVWLTPTNKDELQGATAAKWFLGDSPLSAQKQYKGLVVTTEVPLEQIGKGPLILQNGDLTPPPGKDTNGFVIFALYNGTAELPEDALREIYDPQLPGTAKACRFDVQLQRSSMQMTPHPKKFWEWR